MQIRIVIQSNSGFPTREEIRTTERSIGESYLSEFNLEWAGYIVDNDSMRLAPQWLCWTDDPDELIQYVQANQLRDYTVTLYGVNDEEETEPQLF